MVGYGSTTENISVYYFEQLAHQREGVKKSFYQRYNPDEVLYTNLELEELTTYIEKEHFESFRSEFVGKFIEGDTIVDVSY